MTTSTLAPEQVIEQISASIQPKQDKRIIKSMKAGQMVRQGDIYLINVTGLKQTKVFQNVEVKFDGFITKLANDKNGHQLVPGSTMGSRHIVDNTVSVHVNPTNPSSLVGPLITAKDAFTVSHPEHAHFELPAGDYLVCYQLNAKTQQRVKD